MHEHFYEITNENSVFKDWFAYLEAEKKMKADVRAFKEKHGIKADVYMIHCGKFWVDPDENTQFTEQFGKEREQGLAPFKKTSPIGKAFKEAEIIAARKPFIPFCFKNPVGRSQVRLFDYNGKVYCQYNTEYEVEDTPKGFISMTGGAFYDILDKANAEND